MINEFKKFIMRGNVIDLAVGIIIGAAFTSVVNSLVNDIIMPPIGFITGGVDFSNLFIALSPESFPSLAAAEAALNQLAEAAQSPRIAELMARTALHVMIVAPERFDEIEASLER